MLAITRTPQLLVKLTAAPRRGTLQFANKSLTANFEKLFTSIPAAPAGLGLDMGLGTGWGLNPGRAPEWYTMSTPETGPEVNAWDLCHHLLTEGLSIAGTSPAQFAEPDFEQQWLAGSAEQIALAAARVDPGPEGPDPRLPTGNGPCWFRDAAHSQLELARNAVGEPAHRVRIAHLDTGYDPAHSTLPRHLRTDLQRNFVDNDRPNDASDRSAGYYNNLGHGTGTLSILAGGPINNVPIGGAPFLDIVPIRVANAVIIFKNSSIAKALDYVHSLYADPATRVHVITMSMGGLASRAWADAINALYNLGIFVVTAAGNNFGNVPTHNIVYPARFKRVVAACGAMADGKPYADLAAKIMAGNYGPSSKMDTAIAGFTPNVPWARFDAPGIVDFNGTGTSAATPQVAAAAALWIQKWMESTQNSRNEPDSAVYSEGWMRVEAVRKALFDSALHKPEQREHFGNGFIQANAALALPPAKPDALKRLNPDTASFPFLRVLTGHGISAHLEARQAMLELEALQISQQSRELCEILPDPDSPGDLSEANRQRIIELLHDAPGASRALRNTLAPHARSTVKPTRKPDSASSEQARTDARRLASALDPPIPPPATRPLKVFAFDPLLSYRPGSARLNETIIEIDWEDVKPGPVGEYLEIVDVDPATGCCYAPLDLNHRYVAVNAGLAPSESNPRFHQQMAYAVAMKTIKHFETALGRVALWAPRFVKYTHENQVTIERQYVQRLRIYPHALREANSYYSPDKKALLLGYFPASLSAPGENLPGGSIFCCLSHDIVAHETTHALLDGLHRYFAEPTNRDVLAFHEAIADVVALFQHFTIPEALRSQIEKTRGNLSEGSMLADLALQFGQGIGQFGALRSAIQSPPTREDYDRHTEPHARGAVLVAALFEAFLDIYKRRSRAIIKLAAGPSGLLPEGEMRSDLVDRLANEAAKIARHVLTICIRALDYCPPVDVTFGEFLRALITADRDLVPIDPWDYRAAFVQGFARRGIYPENVRSLSVESLCWEPPEFSIPIDRMLARLDLSWDLRSPRENAWRVSQENAHRVHRWVTGDPEMSDDFAESLGFLRNGDGPFSIAGKSGTLRRFEVHSVRPVRRVGPDGQQRTDLVVEIAQTWVPDAAGAKFRGGCTLIIDLVGRAIRYVVRKRVGNFERAASQDKFQMSLADSSLAFNYFGDAMKHEPFAMMHRAIRRTNE